MSEETPGEKIADLRARVTALEKDVEALDKETRALRVFVSWLSGIGFVVGGLVGMFSSKIVALWK
jgi:hypothetical protein